MNATEELRRYWSDADALESIFRDGALDISLYGVAPAQAIEATLGRVTCHNVWDTKLTGRLRFQCSGCGAVSVEITPRFCPNCGREVER